MSSRLAFWVLLSSSVLQGCYLAEPRLRLGGAIDRDVGDVEGVRRIAESEDGACMFKRGIICPEGADRCHEQVLSECSSPDGSHAVSKTYLHDGRIDPTLQRLAASTLDNPNHTVCGGTSPLKDPTVGDSAFALQVRALRNAVSAAGIKLPWLPGVGTAGSSDRCQGYKRLSANFQANEAKTDMVFYGSQNLDDGSSVCGKHPDALAVTVVRSGSGKILGSVLCFDAEDIQAHARGLGVSLNELFRHVVCHEVGHSLGLEHVPNGSKTCMQEFSPNSKAEINLSFNSEERAQLKTIAQSRKSGKEL